MQIIVDIKISYCIYKKIKGEKTVNKNDMRFFKSASEIAKKSDYGKIHIGCVAVYKGIIVAQGYNSKKSHPIQAKYDKYRNFYETKRQHYYLHAEMDCLNRLDPEIDMSKVKLYIYRKRHDIPHGVCRPCPACMQRIKDLGIKDIYYTSDDGFVEERICL